MNPPITKAVADRNLFRPYVTGAATGSLASWRRWLAFLRVLYGLPIPPGDADTVRTCTGRDPAQLPTAGFDEVLLLCGRRSGKSKIVALVAAAEAVLSGKEKRLAPGELGMVAVLSPTRNQSRIIHGYIKGLFASTPMLANEVANEKGEALVLRNGIELSILTGNPASVRGFSVIAAIVDEIAMFGLSEESKVRSDTELVRALRPSLASTGGRLLCVGSPYAAKGYAYQTWKRAYGSDTCDVLCWNAASLFMNPTLPEQVVTRAVAEDPIAASVEYCIRPGLFREDVDSFITREAVEALVIRGRTRLPPIGGTWYAAFADVSGGRHDDACIAIAHKEGTHIILDVLERYRAPHVPAQVVASMCSLLRAYQIDRCVGDAYAAEWTRTAFLSHGIQYRRATTSVWNEGTRAKNKIAKPKSVLYADLLPRLHSAEVELLDLDILVSQLASLQRRTRSGARDSIDHPPGGHDDCANVLAGVVDAVSQRRRTVGALTDPRIAVAVAGAGWDWDHAAAGFEGRAAEWEKYHEQIAPRK
jgi:hypothetical protein